MQQMRYLIDSVNHDKSENNKNENEKNTRSTVGPVKNRVKSN